MSIIIEFFFSSRRRHTRWPRDWSSDVCSSDLRQRGDLVHLLAERPIGKTHLQKQYPRRGAGSGCYALPVTLMPHRIVEGAGAEQIENLKQHQSVDRQAARFLGARPLSPPAKQCKYSGCTQD